jgi:hypothetical protein
MKEVDLTNYAETILPEFDRETASTRKVLERVPENKLDLQAHPKSHTIGWNANHLAEIPDWVEAWLSVPSWDFASIGGELYQSPKLTSHQEILDLFDRNVAAARKAIAAVKDDQMTQPWFGCARRTRAHLRGFHVCRGWRAGGHPDRAKRTAPNQRLKLTGAAMLVFRASTFLQAAPAA